MRPPSTSPPHTSSGDEGAKELARVAKRSKTLRALITTSNDIEQVCVCLSVYVCVAVVCVCVSVSASLSLSACVLTIT